ncbi:MAG: ketol-acid reductoisomerase [Candidatus Melainabacteria bacterium]|nr:ketol-acid reductoisomerase [Candidatus Melainabacteria bacterium]
MASIYYDDDANLDQLQDLNIGVIGYGNQGRAQALNLRDSGLTVWVGTKEGKGRTHALADGFPAHTPEEVAANCEVLALLLPDEVLPYVYSVSVEPYLEAHDTFVFAHGFTVRHKTLRLPDDADVVLVAPTGPGRQLRSLFEECKGLPALVAVEQDASGVAWQRCLAYAKAVGCTRAGVIETTFEEETVTDLFCEQAVLCGGMPELIKASFDILVDKGYQPELAYISCLKEVKLICDLLFERGIHGMRSAISNTAKFGSALAGPEIIDASTRYRLAKVLQAIESGKFARQFIEEAAQGSPAVHELLLTERHSHLARTGAKLSQNIRF